MLSLNKIKKNILILGIGNLLMRDDGIGIHVAQRMKDMTLPPDVEVIDGGMLVLEYLYLIEGREKVIVIDAIKTDDSPGTIYRYKNGEIEKKRKDFSLTPHEAAFMKNLNASYLLGTNPEEVIFIGIRPADTGESDLKLDTNLSPTLEKKVPEIIEMVMKEIMMKGGKLKGNFFDRENRFINHRRKEMEVKR